MSKRKMMFVLGVICVIVLVAGLAYSSLNTSNIEDTTKDATDSSSSSDDDSTHNTNDNGSTGDDKGTTDTSGSTDNSSDDSSSGTTSNFSSTTVTEELVNNKSDHTDDEDYTWDSSAVVTITLNGNSITTNGENCTIINGTIVTITSAATYSISGTLNDGQIIVDTNDKETVRLILNDVTIASTTNAPVYVANADKTVIVLAQGTENYLTDNENNEENATILSKDDLTIYGDGSLIINGNDNDGIHINDGLVIESGTIIVNSVDDGICGKDYLIIKGGDITVNSVGDGLKSDNDDDSTKGYITIEDGKIEIISTQGDSINAQTDLTITGGTFTLTSGGGSGAWVNENLSTKGLKAGVSIDIDGGEFTIDSSDDAVHSNDVIIINSGNFILASGDDAIHADTTLEINDGTFVISQSYEGLESTTITINDGDVQITASDDGINVAGGTARNEDFMGGRPGPGGGGEAPGNYYIYINGGVIYINSGGDGLDSDGYIEMTDGLLIINGPTANNNGAIDYGGGSFELTGGTIIAVGSAGMAQAPSSITQNVANLQFGSTMSADVLVHIQSASGEGVLTFNPEKTYQSVVFTSPDFDDGTYTVYIGGSSTGTSTYGLYEGGTYNGGTEYGSFTVS